MGIRSLIYSVLGKADYYLSKPANERGLDKVISSDLVAEYKRVPAQSQWGLRTLTVAAGLVGVLLAASYIPSSVYAKGSKSAAAKESEEDFARGAMDQFFKGLDKSKVMSKSGSSDTTLIHLTPELFNIYVAKDYDRYPSIGLAFENAKKLERDVLEGRVSSEEIRKNFIVDSGDVKVIVYDGNGFFLDAIDGGDIVNENRVLKVPPTGSIVVAGNLFTSSGRVGGYEPLPLMTTLYEKVRFMTNLGLNPKCNGEEYVWDHFISSQELQRAVKCSNLLQREVKLVIGLPIPTLVEKKGKKSIKMKFGVEGADATLISVPLMFVPEAEIDQIKMDARFRKSLEEDLTPSVPGPGLARPSP